MVERTPILNFVSYALLLLGVLALAFPIYYCIVAATLPLDAVLQVPMPLTPSTHLFENIHDALTKSNLGAQLWNSLLVALGVAFGKIGISILSAYAIVYFPFRVRMLAFWMIFVTLMLPVEVRILPTYEVAANLFSPITSILHLFHVELDVKLSLLNSYSGLILPLIASATATFLFRQFFLTIPEELCEAAKIDGAGPLQFFWHVLLPLSKTNIAALFVILFVTGWNQYLWPLLVTTESNMRMAVVGVQELIPHAEQAPHWNTAMAGALLVMLPPVLVVVLMQRWFVKGLIEHEK
jgi:sn-glycerol 3-phosphate transport system permease protein